MTQWFSAARDIDDERGERLGTLGYLPWEIRQMILVAVIHKGNPHRFAYDYWQQYTLCPHYYPQIFPESGSCSYGMRFASPSTKFEFEHCYLTNKRFYFEEGNHLRAFLGDLSIYQQSLLRYLDLDLSRAMDAHCNMNDWVACCALLPPNLLSIQFRIQLWPWTERKIGEEWFICYLDEEPPMLKNIVKILNVLGKSARRCAARTKIGFFEESPHPMYKGPDWNKWVRVFDEVEPWSKYWLEWWEEDTKFDMDSGEGANDMA